MGISAAKKINGINVFYWAEMSRILAALLIFCFEKYVENKNIVC